MAYILMLTGGTLDSNSEFLAIVNFKYFKFSVVLMVDLMTFFSLNAYAIMHAWFLIINHKTFKFSNQVLGVK